MKTEIARILRRKLRTHWRSGVSPLPPDAGAQNNPASQSVNDEFISLPASGIPDHKNCRTDCFIYPQGDDVETKSVETAYQEELENATIEAKASCEQDCVKNVRISVRPLDEDSEKWMKNRKPSLANGGVVKIVSCTRG